MLVSDNFVSGIENKGVEIGMFFNYMLGLQEINTENVKVNCRKAVRGVILDNANILLVQSNKGDYKFPGGGIHIGENHEETLRREVKEETGYIVDNVLHQIGVVTERNADVYEENSVFEMISYYYLCKVTDEQVFQQLDDYEKELGFRPVWTSFDKAIYFNEDVLKQQMEGKNRWVYRETMVLKALKDCYDHI